MAKTTRPLRMLVHPSLWETVQVQELMAKQNVVDRMDYGDISRFVDHTDQYDLVLGPNCWRIIPGMEGQITSAVQAARRQRYGKKGVEDGSEESVG